jgi:homocysteine S-methyltransferase
MDLNLLIKASPLVLTEAAVIERLAQDPHLQLHQHLFNAPLIYTDQGRQAFYALYRDYIDVALQANLPMLLQTPTWRTDHDRIRTAGWERPLHRDAVHFMRNLIRDLVPQAHPILLGGLMGSRRDCYRPERAPDAQEAERYHAWQVEKLSEAGIDFLLAATLPSVAEAKGLARAMRIGGQPYLISFVINQQGRILDGTKIAEAIRVIDRATGQDPPLGYMVNCAYPSFLDRAAVPPSARKRLVGYQANASSKPHGDLDGSPIRHMDDIDDWVKRMAALHRQWGLRILGGCCGTRAEHLQGLVAKICGPRQGVAGRCDPKQDH